MSIYGRLLILSAMTSAIKAASKGIKTPRPPLRSLSVRGYGPMRSFIRLFYNREKEKHYGRVSRGSWQ